MPLAAMSSALRWPRAREMISTAFAQREQRSTSTDGPSIAERAGSGEEDSDEPVLAGEEEDDEDEDGFLRDLLAVDLCGEPIVYLYASEDC